MKKLFSIFVSVFIFLAAIFLFSCVSVPQKKVSISRNLTGKPMLSADELYKYFVHTKRNCNREELAQVRRLAEFYVQEAAIEGINSDCAFAQMCLETGYLSFGNLVVPEMHNYCGLGAMDSEHPGEWFETEQIGVRAHIQHLQAYATTEDVQLKQELVDPRYSWVHKAKFAQTVFDLAGSWATDKMYGEKLDSILDKMEYF